MFLLVNLPTALNTLEALRAWTMALLRLLTSAIHLLLCAIA